MFGIGLSELVLVVIVALIALGPEKLPAVARALGKAYSEFRKAGEEVKKSFMEAARAEQKDGKPEAPVSGQADKE
ncbi:MAG TPA: twin-arginine translocase subunit TatB [Deltaproteobacteria bacterium]|nr:MAG: twin arginine-targeting protein translocase TatB [Deltaproteobacteria bacterium GWA2_55_82]OGQ64498.1 MAG: twin arginine-targeting protein translocase TatB [Deltaproteobacteria bacterium RIFCSPLOWO2_02_FULL_55_12]OIJ73623.1 MAG: twin arginine-targeting protein translocase TatB [Deltaproteobacteria bacterium GWC2_55_46]HBG47761.1 twin-arginine translocase subunit TatB [Deltaproteobacteria bacterium]HCY12017.1 twin-arginine translocase subunit TatB [Deltaproteobacteria bacterium]